MKQKENLSPISTLMGHKRKFLVINNLPDSNSLSNKVTKEFSEDVLEFLTLLVDAYLQVRKLNKAPPE